MDLAHKIRIEATDKENAAFFQHHCNRRRLMAAELKFPVDVVDHVAAFLMAQHPLFKRGFP